MPRCTGFRITGYDGREVWRLLHQLASKKDVGDFMVFFHNVINFGLGKPLYGTTADQFLKDVTQPGAMPVAKALRHGTTLEDLRRGVVAIVAKEERLPCPHCRSHGLKWFHALCDMVRNHGNNSASLAFYRPAGMLHFVGPYRAYCRLVTKAVHDSAARVAPPPDVRPCAMGGAAPVHRATNPAVRQGKRPMEEQPARPMEEQPVRPMVGVLPAEPRPQSPSRGSAVDASEWRQVVPAAKRRRVSQQGSASTEQEVDEEESSDTDTETGSSSSEDDAEDDDAESSATATASDRQAKSAVWGPVSRPRPEPNAKKDTVPTARPVPEPEPAAQPAEPKTKVRAAAAMGLDWL